MAKKVLDQRIEIGGKKEMNRLVNLLLKKEYEVSVYSDSHQREKQDRRRPWLHCAICASRLR